MELSKISGDIALELKREFKEWRYHQEISHGLARLMFIREHAMVCILVDEVNNTLTVNSNWDAGCTHEKFCKITQETIKKVIETVTARATFIEELKKF